MSESRYKKGDPVPVSVLRIVPPILNATFACDVRVVHHTDGSCTVHKEGPGEHIIRVTGEGAATLHGAPTEVVLL